MATQVEKAFEEVINTRGISSKIDIKESTVYSLRQSFKKDKVSIKRMREILELAGYQMVQEETWRKAP